MFGSKSQPIQKPKNKNGCDIMYINNSLDISNIGESIAISEFTRYHIQAFIPFGHNTPIDLIIALNNRLIRIQCKTTFKTINNEYMKFNLTRDTRAYKHLKYTKEEIDYFFLYCIENNFRGLISVNEADSTDMIIRLSRPKNNQIKFVKMFYEYDFDYQIKRLMVNYTPNSPIYFY